MRGKAEAQVMMLSLVTADQLVPEDHPIRQIKPIVDNALRELSSTFSRMYAETGRPSIPPEHLLKACLLIALYSVRSERQFCERLRYDLLFKWFLDLNITDPAFDASTLLQEQREAAGARRGERVSGSGARRGGAAQVIIRGPLHRGRHVTGGVGILEEFPSQG
jgi:hypothetical protein